jgi:hypothetical protein
MKTKRGSSQLKPDGAVASLREEYRFLQSLYDCQPAIIQRFIQSQARQLAEELTQERSQARFSLPDQVVVEVSLTRIPPQRLPPEFREQVTGSVIDRITRADMRTLLRVRLVDLEESPEKTVAVAARLTRLATALFMVQNMLPSGRTVHYVTGEGEEIPSIPSRDHKLKSSILAPGDAVIEEGHEEKSRGELQVPYTPAALQFYLPQWVAFDQDGRLLVKTVNEAEAYLASMQRYLSVLHTAVSIAPYIVADEEYQQKRYGILGQLVNQGRLLASYETDEIIRVIHNRASTGDLNRGLSLSLPYFNDQDLEMRLLNFEVIPSGRVMFVPAFVVRAARQEQAKVAQDTRLSPSTRKYLLAELKRLETAFIVE